MAYDNTEIEIKLKLDDGQVDGVLSALKSVATFVKNSRQRDTYFVPAGDDFLAEKYPYKWLSVRERGGDKILNFKHFYPEKAEKHEYAKEYEVKIDNIENLTAIFDELNIRKAVTVEKSRDIYRYKDEYEITLDNVTGLGYFMEVEAQKELGTPEETKEVMLAFVRSLEVGEVNVDYRGYPFLLLAREKADI
jgi:adenylate cyclase class 2